VRLTPFFTTAPIVAVRTTVLTVAAISTVGCAAASPRAVQGTPATETLPATSLATAPDRYFANGDVRLRYREIGRGEPVVLLHGLGGSLDAWEGVADSLATGYRVIAVDERGFGKSTRFNEPSRYGSAMSEDVVGLLDYLQIPRAHLVGHSMGAVVAANVAARHPSRVASVSLFGPPLYADSAAYMQAAAEYVDDLNRGRGLRRMIQWLEPGTSDSTASAWSAAALTTNEPATLTAVLNSLGTLMITADRGRSIAVPALIAVGSNDPLIVQDRVVATWWPHSRFVEVSGVAHGDVINRPEALAALRARLREQRQ
jgi:pimeloyl-ACP methyl ester carboxylesterase